MSTYFEKYKSLSKNEADPVIGLNQVISESFKKEVVDINFLEYILISSELKIEREIYKKECNDYARLSLEEMLLLSASEKNCLQLVTFIFTNSNVDKETLNRSLDYSLYLAAKSGSFEIVEYLTSSFDLSKPPNINHVQSPLMAACESGHLNIVKFLLESPKLKEHASLDIIQDYYSFTHLCNIFSSNQDSKSQTEEYINKRLSIMQYLILDTNLQKTPAIEQYLNKPENKIIKNIFDVKDLNYELKSDSNIESNMRKPKL